MCFFLLLVYAFAFCYDVPFLFVTMCLLAVILLVRRIESGGIAE